MIFDTDILIWVLRRQKGAIEFTDRISHDERNISVISELELLRGCRSRDEIIGIHNLLNDQFSEIVPLTEAACQTAQRLMVQFTLTRHPGTNDTLIAATALARGESVATGNLRHFDYIPGLGIHPFRP